MREIRLQHEIIIRTANEIDALSRVSRILSDQGINLLSVALITDGEDVSIHVVTSSQSFAIEALREVELPVEERDVLVVELPHHPGFLCRISEALARKDIAIHDLYATVAQGSRTGLVVLACSNNSKALHLLQRH